MLVTPPKLLLVVVVVVFAAQVLGIPKPGGQAPQEHDTPRTADQQQLKATPQTQASEVLLLLRRLRPSILRELSNLTQGADAVDREAAVADYIRGAEDRMAIADVLKACIKLRAALLTGITHGRELSKMLTKLRKRLTSLHERLLEAAARSQVPEELNQLLKDLGLSAVEREEVIGNLSELIAKQAQPSRRRFDDHKQEIISFPINI
ncbi:hypothetical protein SprV_0702310000 [Sparganum proliferum]